MLFNIPFMKIFLSNSYISILINYFNPLSIHRIFNSKFTHIYFDIFNDFKFVIQNN